MACVVAHPLDTIRTQMTAAVGKSTILGVARVIGLKGLYRVGARVSRGWSVVLFSAKQGERGGELNRGGE